ncbi:MAG TPA: preprotein translocase subunit YajC [Candidatus Onthomonas avicola]|nr:preprotein translocase subunit YajC [Candidatus Onthomonas avicola]
MDMLSGILMVVVMIAIFYFMLIRPENKRKKQAQEMRDSLAVGDEITTIGGIVGTICAVKANSIVIETGADRVRLEMMKWSVSSKGVQVSEDEKTSDNQKAADAKKKK